MIPRILALALTLVLTGRECVLAQEAQQVIRVPEYRPSSIGGDIGQYQKMHPDMQLVPRGSGARHGHLWIRNIGTSLLIIGELTDGDTPEWPRNKNRILASDHVELWLAGKAEVPLPVIGWGHQFGEQELEQGEASCADWAEQGRNASGDPKRPRKKCVRWVRTQQRYREVFKRLFVRQWLLTPDYSMEVFATPAYDEITNKYASDQPRYSEEVPEALRPTGKVQMWWFPRGGQPGYTFQILIPYTAFPPLDALEVHDLLLMVDVFNTAPEGKKQGPFSTSSPARTYGRPESFNRLRLDPPRVFEMTPCGMPLTGDDKYRKPHPGWFIPRQDSAEKPEAVAFLLVNTTRGYAYEPEGLSPIVRPVHFFWQTIEKGEWICGPRLAYRKGELKREFTETVAENGFEARRLTDGRLLIKVGPLVYWSEFGSGQCGGCPRTELQMLVLDKNLAVVGALDLGDVVDVPIHAQDFVVSPDWTQVTQYDQKRYDGPWSSVTYCLGKQSYEKCGEEQNVTPPNPPVLKEIR